MNARLPSLVYELERAREKLSQNSDAEDIHSVTNTLIQEVLRHINQAALRYPEPTAHETASLWITELLSELSEVCLTLCADRAAPQASSHLIEAIDSARRKRLWLTSANRTKSPFVA